MLIDKNLQMSAAQAVTVTAPSTNHFDTLAPGDAVSPGAMWVLSVGAALTAGGAATLQAELQTADDAAFTENLKTLASTGVLATIADYGKAGKVLFAGAIPAGMRRFVRTYYTVATGPLTAGSLNSNIALTARVPLS